MQTADNLEQPHCSYATPTATPLASVNAHSKSTKEIEEYGNTSIANTEGLNGRSRSGPPSVLGSPVRGIWLAGSSGGGGSAVAGHSERGVRNVEGKKKALKRRCQDNVSKAWRQLSVTRSRSMEITPVPPGNSQPVGADASRPLPYESFNHVPAPPCIELHSVHLPLEQPVVVQQQQPARLASRQRTHARVERGFCPTSASLFPCFGPGHVSDDSDDDWTMNGPSSERSGLSTAQIATLGAELRSQMSLMDAPLVRGGGARCIAEPYPVHTQVEYTHYLVPDLLAITNASYYWGIMDRHQAEKLLEHKPEGTFLLRDSAQNDYLFSVSFRRYGRTLHARIEQLNHRFSFDAYDPGVFCASTVTALIDHYKNPAVCLFFEPQLSNPLKRKEVFSLQHLARAVICNGLAYDDVQTLALPKQLKDYLKEYHYKKPVRVSRLD